jgi:hypothetical protein
MNHVVAIGGFASSPLRFRIGRLTTHSSTSVESHMLRPPTMRERGTFPCRIHNHTVGKLVLAIARTSAFDSSLGGPWDWSAEHFEPPVAVALGEGALDGVLHFSARSAEAYLACAAHGGIGDRALAPVHYCLSRQVAAPLTAAGAAAVLIAARPDEAALLELVGAA